MIEAGRDYLLFDGDCGICAYSAERCERMDKRRQFTIWPYQSFTEAELAQYGISYADCDRKLQVITRRGRVYAGAFGVNYFLWRQFPWSLLVFLIYALPVLLLAELLGYALVARYRRQLSQWFGLKACLLKQSQ
jgi:predicted DCC family thiol-disulfide oxidoreductase YuxK